MKSTGFRGLRSIIESRLFLSFFWNLGRIMKYLSSRGGERIKYGNADGNCVSVIRCFDRLIDWSIDFVGNVT